MEKLTMGGWRALLISLVLLLWTQASFGADAEPVRFYANGNKAYQVGASLTEAFSKADKELRFLGDWSNVVCKSTQAKTAAPLIDGMLKVPKGGLDCTIKAAKLSIKEKDGADDVLAIASTGGFFVATPITSVSLLVGQPLEVVPAASQGKCEAPTLTDVPFVSGRLTLSEARQFTCTIAGGPALTVHVTKTESVATGTPEPPKDPASVPACDATALRMPAPPAALKCGEIQSETGSKPRVTLCVGLDGSIVGRQPELEQGQRVTVKLLAPSQGPSATLSVAFQREVFLPSVLPPATERSSAGTAELASSDVTLRSAGKLKILVTRIGGTIQRSSTNGGTTSTTCTVQPGTGELEIKIEGEYYLSVGLAPILSARKTLEIGTQTGADGVRRIEAKPNDAFDIALNVVAYPQGVHEFDVINVGGLIGTSLTNPGRSWYLGPQLAFPAAGVGLTGGVSLNIVDVLKGDLADGQPFAGDTVPTTTGVQMGWFVGANLEDGLFRKIFGAALPKD